MCIRDRFQSEPFNALDDGSFDVDLDVRRFIDVGIRREVDCAVERCVIGVGRPDDIAVDVEAPLVFSPEAEAKSPPTLSVVAGAYSGIEAVGRVTGSGFAPGKVVRLSQCPLGEAERSVSADDCLYENGLTVTAQEDGSIDGEMTVFSKFQRLSLIHI